MKETRSTPSIRARVRRFPRIAAALTVATLLAVSAAGVVPAAAQESGPAQGITTIGYGEATTPAESAILQILLTQEDFGPPRPPRPSATPGAEQRELSDPVIQALLDAGLTEEDIEVVISPIVGQYYSIGGPGIARIDIAVDEPTRERILELINAAVPVAARQGVLVGQVGVGYNVDDCTALEREARAGAFADATRRAEIQADLLGGELGDPVASNDLPPADSNALVYFGRAVSSEAGCAPPSPSLTEGNSVNLPPFDPAGEAEVEVIAQVAVTFELADAPAA